jgi:hypothetical protein
MFLTAAAWAQDPNAAAIRTSVEKGLAVLQPTGPTFFKKSGCVSCHHQALPAMATGLARERGFGFDEKIANQEIKSIMAFVKPAREVLLEGSDIVPDVPSTGSYLLMGLAAHKYPADDTTTAIVHNIAIRQNADGSWTGWSPRPPINYGDIRETAVSVRALDLYAPKGRREEFQSRIERARSWLLAAQPNTPEEGIFRLLGLTWAKAEPKDLRKAAEQVLAAQRPDGGWAQLAMLPSDAYATGEALVALHESGIIDAGRPAYQRGVSFLLRTQTQDGSWHVITRAFPFQPLIDTGFPHGRDQWISATGTAWALMGLMLTAEPVQTLAAAR